MTKSDFTALRRTLNFIPSWQGQATSLTLVFSTISLATVLIRHEHMAAFGASQVLFAFGAFQAFAVLHDCGHGSFAKTKWVNTLVGHVASIFCLTPYFSWKYIHHQHHVWSGNTEKDPAVAVLHRWRQERRVPPFPTIAWRLWLPVIAFVQQVVFATYPLKMLRSGRLNWSKAWRSILSVVFVVGSFALISLLFEINIMRDLGLAWLLYLFVTEVVNTPHHIDRPSHNVKLPIWKQASTTRSCEYPSLVAKVLTLNFNLHTEHHIFPTLPWYRLHLATPGVRKHERKYRGSKGMSWVFKNRLRSLKQVALVRSDGKQ